MSSVDDRIVNMQFNNKQFTQGVDQTKRDLTGLDQTLAKAGKSSGLDKMGNSVQQVSTKFSALQVAGVTAVATIANKVTLAAGSMLKKLTIQPLMDGFKEYQTNLESIQTIMANTGKDVDTVNKYLGELNKYSDQTIYNFSQMAKNIGTFTAAGVELDTATSAIKGISNLAALSGSNSQQASTAMYQLSQAIAAGKVGLMDWNSVVNAGMGGKVFKNALAQTAVAMGDLSAGAVKVGTDVEIMGTSFRNSISAAAGQESWLSSEVLVATLSQLDGRFSRARMAAEGFTKAKQQDMIIEQERQKLQKQGIEYSDEEFEKMVEKADAAYAAATQIKTATQLFQVLQESIGSMWAGAFQIILGDFEQSKELWGNVGDVVLGIVNKISGGFLGMLRTWEERGGRMKVIDGLANVFGGLVDIFGAIAKGFDRAFPDSNVSLLNRISKAFFAFSEALVPSEETLKDIGTIAEAAFSILHLGFTIVKGVAKGLSAFFGALFGATDGARGGILSMAASIAEVIIAVEDWLTSGSKITRFLKGIGEVAGTALSPIIATIGLLVDAFASLISGEGLGGAADAFGRAKDVFGEFLGGIISGLDNITAPFDGLKSDIADFAGKAAEPFQGFIDKLDAVRLKLVSGLGLDRIAPSMDGLRTLAQRAQDAFVNFAEGLRLPTVSLEDLGNAADWVVERFQAMADAVGETVSNLNISGKLKSAKDAIAGLFEGMGGGASSGASTAAASGAAAVTATADGAVSAWEAVGDVMSSVWGVFESMASGIGDFFGWVADKMSNIPFPDDALEWATVLNALISGALIKRLFFSKGVLGELKQAIQDIGQGASDSFNELTNTLKTMQGAIKAELIKNIAIAVALLVASLLALSYVPADKLKQGLGALAAVMAMTGAMMQLMMMSLKKISAADLVKYGAGFLLVGVGMMAMATAVLILTAAVAALAFIPFEKLEQGLGAVAIVMGIMTASLLLLSGQSAKVAAVGAAMVLMATAVDILVAAILVLGVLPFDTLEQGLGAVAVGIGIMTASLLLLSGNSAKILAAGAAMVLMATALNILVPLIVTLGLLPWDVVTQGLTAMAIGLGIMTLSLMLLGGAGPAVLAAAGAMMLLAMSLNILVPLIVTLGALPWEVVSRGLAAMGIALALLLAAGALAMFIIPGLQTLALVILAIGAAVLMAGTGMALFVGALALLVTVGVAAIGIITLAIHAFIALLPSIAIQVAAAFVAFLQAIAMASPKIRKAMVEIIRNMINTVRDLIPDLEALFHDLLNAGINVITSMAAEFGLVGVTIIMKFLEGLGSRMERIVDAAYKIAEEFISGMGDRAVDLANAGADALIDMLNGFETAVRTKGPQIRSAVGGLADAMRDEFVAATVDLFTSIPMPDLPNWMTNPTSLIPNLGRTKAGGGGGGYNPLEGQMKAGADLAKQVETSLTNAGNNLLLALERAVVLLTSMDKTGAAAGYARQADAAETASTYNTTKAGILGQRATAQEEKVARQMEKADKIKDKKKKEAAKKAIREKAGAEAKELRKKEAKATKAAEQASALAEQKSNQAREELTFQAAMSNEDFRGAGDVRSQQGQDMADKAQSMLAAANAKADQADKLAKGTKKERELAKRLRKEARDEAAAANQLAVDAIAIQGQAQDLYNKARIAAAKAVRDRMAGIRAALAEQDAQRAWDEQFEQLEGDSAGQAAMLNKRADDNVAKAAEARRLMDQALANAEAWADTDAEAANAALDEAEKQAQIANQAADAAEQDRDQAEQLLKQAEQNQNAGTTTSGAVITPSRTAMEDAAGAVDRYTTSLQQAEAQAGAGSSSVVFNQNNYSPEALPASTIYRNGKNMVAAAEIKMAGT